MRTILSILVANAALLLLAGGAGADVDLTVLPERDSVQITVYNSADLTLVREVRTLTLREGDNRLSFAWSGTLVDPTSVALRAPKHGDRVELINASYPPRIGGKAVWTVKSEVAGPVPVEITYFISGVSWHAFYMATLSRDELSVKIQGYVRVTNQSGDDFANAQTRLIVGKIHQVDAIAELAKRTEPYGRPGPMVTVVERFKDGIEGERVSRELLKRVAKAEMRRQKEKPKSLRPNTKPAKAPMIQPPAIKVRRFSRAAGKRVSLVRSARARASCSGAVRVVGAALVG